MEAGLLSRLSIFVAVLVGVVPEVSLAANVYQLVPLGTGPSIAEGLNNQGQVVGAFVSPDGNDHAFMWQAGSGIT